MSEWRLVIDGARPADVADSDEVQIHLHGEDGTHFEQGGGVAWEFVNAYRILDTRPPLFDSKPTNPKDAIGVRKVHMSCLPAGVVLDVSNALLEGGCKYGRHNYRAVGVRASVYYDASMGHQMDWWEGEDTDPDSGLCHITKAIASLVVLRDAMLQGMLTDDRPPRSKVFKRDFNPAAAALIDRHADKSPRHYTIADTPT